VLFVDTPRDLRLARVRASRGWDDAELARREASQIPLGEKRRRSSDLVANTGDPAALEAAVAAALDAIIARTAPT
jgi:dephospho-CoA kinase